MVWKIPPPRAMNRSELHCGEYTPHRESGLWKSCWRSVEHFTYTTAFWLLFHQETTPQKQATKNKTSHRHNAISSATLHLGLRILGNSFFLAVFQTVRRGEENPIRENSVAGRFNEVSATLAAPECPRVVLHRKVAIPILPLAR